MEIAVLGGTFNPPTIAHQAMIEACAAQPFIDEVWVLPSGQRADKQFETSNADRLYMLEVAIAATGLQDMVRIETLEIEQEGRTETCVTAAVLAARHPADRLWLVFGMDAYQDMPQWRDGDRLQRELSLLVIPRDGHEDVLSSNAKLLPIDLQAGLSSTEIRRRTAQAQPITGLTCQGVERYIQQRQLYQTV